ncbi:acyl-CoA N-acyltransferase, partial [Chytriomyces sp. MP71]
EPPPTILVHAEESHAPLLARLATETFSDTFGTQCNSADLASHIATSYNVDTLRREIASEHVYFLCLASDPRAVDPLGFCQFHLARSPLLSSDDAADPCWSVHRFYLRRGAQGLGVAVPMMQFVLQRMREERARTVWLFVHSENLRAKRFY